MNPTLEQVSIKEKTVCQRCSKKQGGFEKE